MDWFDPLAEHAREAYLRYAFTKGTEQEVGFLVERLRLGPGCRVLDVGCGPGRHSHALARRGVEVVGLDRSAAFLAVAARRGAGRPARGGSAWVRADATQLPFPPSSFDAVISLCQGGFGLLGGDGDVAAFRAMAAVLRPGGRLAASAFSAYFAVRYLEAGDRFDAGAGVNHEVSTVRSPEGVDAAFDLWTTCFTPRELRLMAAGAGLAVEGLWSVRPGDYAARPPDLDHPEWLLLCSSAQRAARAQGSRPPGGNVTGGV